jgi:hypothetical protein
VCVSVCVCRCVCVDVCVCRCSDLPEGRPLLLLQCFGVVGRVQGVVVRVTVCMEDVSRAELVERSHGNSRHIPESHCTVLMPKHTHTHTHTRTRTRTHTYFNIVAT